jgi:membrane protease subunit (stomatin/prohibitin family)
MTIELTNEEKLNIVNQHLKSVDYSIYGLQLDLLEINSISNPDASQVSNINTRITAANAKRAALVTERDSLTSNTEE